MVDLISLENGFGKPVQPEVHQQQAESRDHRNQPEVRRREQPGQYHGRDNLDSETSPLGKYSCTSATDSEPAQRTHFSNGLKRATGIKWFQVVSWQQYVLVPSTDIRVRGCQRVSEGLAFTDNL